MGMSQVIYTVGWLVYYALNAFLITFVMMLFLVLGVFGNGKTEIMEPYTWVNVALLFFMYALSVVGFTMTLSTFFSRAKTAAQATSFIQLLSSLLTFLRFSEDFLTNRSLILATTILPQQSFNMGILSFAFYNSSFPLPRPDFSYEDSLIALSLDVVVYLAISIYLDQVWPNEVGTNKHPLFFVRWIWHRAPERRHDFAPLLDG